MKDYYKILELSDKCDASEIKSAYRKLSKKYHPDLNSDSEAEDKFKEIAEAYEILGNESKRKEYDGKRSGRRYKASFEDWANDFMRRDSGFGRGRGFSGHTRSAVPNSDYLNIQIESSINLKDAILGNPLEINYEKWVVGADLLKSKETKILNIHLDLRKKYIKIVNINGKYHIDIRLQGLGNEDIFERPTPMFGEIEKMVIFGDILIKVKIEVPQDVEISDCDIIQYIDIPLHKVLFPSEKIRISTILDKTYDAEINYPNKLNNLKFNIKGQGILSHAGNTGNYVIKFNVLSPDLSGIDNDTLNLIKEQLSK